MLETWNADGTWETQELLGGHPASDRGFELRDKPKWKPGHPRDPPRAHRLFVPDIDDEGTCAATQDPEVETASTHTMEEALVVPEQRRADR